MKEYKGLDHVGRQESRRIVKAECNEHGVFCYLNTDNEIHELCYANTLLALTGRVE